MESRESLPGNNFGYRSESCPEYVDVDNLSKIFNLSDDYDGMEEIDENCTEGSALSIFDGHAYTTPAVKMNDSAVEGERMKFIDELYEAIHKDRAVMQVCFEKVTQCTVGWFSRSSFANKLKFILPLLQDNTSLSFLSTLQNKISSSANSKDLIYSTSQAVGAFEYDVVATGQNGSMDEHTLRRAHEETLTWFASFSELSKMRILLGMLAASGGAILRRVYLELNQIVDARVKTNELIKVMKAADTFLRVASKYCLYTEDAVKELPYDILEAEHNLAIEEQQEEERQREDMEAEAKKAAKNEKKEKEGNGKKGKEVKTATEEGEVDKGVEEKKENEEKKEENPRFASHSAVTKEEVKDHPLDLVAREKNAVLENALEQLRLKLKVDEHGKQYPAPPPPVVEVEKKGKKGKKEKKGKEKEKEEEQEEKGGKKGKKGKDGKKGKEGKKEKEAKPKKEKKEKSSTGKMGKGEHVDPGIDQIQLLPLPLNRQIIAMLEEKQLKAAKQVSAYWTRMVEDVAAERKMRRALDEAVKKLGGGGQSTGGKGSKKSGKKGKKGSGGSKNKLASDKATKKSSEKSSKSSKSSKSTKSKRSKSAKSMEKVPAEVPSRVAPAQGEEAARAALLGQPQAVRDVVFTNRCLRTNVANRFCASRVTAASPDGRVFASATPAAIVEFYSLHTGALLSWKLAGHDRVVTCMQYLDIKGTEYLVTGSKDRTARLWDVSRLEQERVYLGHTEALTAVAATDTHIATVAAADRLLRVCDLWSTALVMSVALQLPASAMTMSGDTVQVFVGFPNGDISVFSVRSKALVITVVGHDKEVTCLHLARTLLASGGGDGVARVWSVADFSANCLAAFRHTSGVRCVHLHGRHLFCACADDAASVSVSVWSMRNGGRLKLLRLPGRCQPVALAVHTEPEFARVLVSTDVAVHAYEFYLHGSLRTRRSRSQQRKAEGDAPPQTKKAKVHFEEGHCARGGCTGLPVTGRHPACRRTGRHEEREQQRKRRGFPEPRFFRERDGDGDACPADFLHDLLNYELPEDGMRGLALFPQVLSERREIPAPPTYPPPDPNAPEPKDPKYKVRTPGSMDVSYKQLLELYNAQYLA